MGFFKGVALSKTETVDPSIKFGVRGYLRFNQTIQRKPCFQLNNDKYSYKESFLARALVGHNEGGIISTTEVCEGIRLSIKVCLKNASTINKEQVFHSEAGVNWAVGNQYHGGFCNIRFVPKNSHSYIVQFRYGDQTYYEGTSLVFYSNYFIWISIGPDGATINGHTVLSQIYSPHPFGDPVKKYGRIGIGNVCEIDDNKYVLRGNSGLQIYCARIYLNEVLQEEYNFLDLPESTTIGNSVDGGATQRPRIGDMKLECLGLQPSVAVITNQYALTTDADR